jgi:acyl-CoA reductase-like NAD-dependent aldehyde dehydrogenase
MSLQVSDEASWSAVWDRVVRRAPQAFGPDRLLNLIDGVWVDGGTPELLRSPVDGAPMASLLRVDAKTATDAVVAAHGQHVAWSKRPLSERIAVITAAVEALTDARDDLSYLLAWEIGKPWRLATADVDRCLDGVRWYLENIEQMLSVDADGKPFQRQALPGPVSNIASWNYPMSVLVHAELVQALAGNAVVAKTPTQGGAVCLTLAHALMAQVGVPVTLLSGFGSQLSDALVRSPEIGALAFVGGRSNGGKVAASLVDTGKRHMLEQEGLNAWGIWDFSDWDMLATHLKKGYEYAKQRCTAYPRFVVQRQLVDQFLATYLPVVQSVKFGHPLATEGGTGALPELDFGSLISAVKATELNDRVAEAMRWGAIPLYRGTLEHGRFIDGQDTSAYHAPATLLAPPGASRLMHEEPFGPVDTIVVVDTEAELLAQMNASNGSLVASLACDDLELAGRLAEQVQAFKVGINKPRSRGDREEAFGGRGGSWKGAFVGGIHLVHAVTQGPDDERLYGNFPGYSRTPVPA